MAHSRMNDAGDPDLPTDSRTPEPIEEDVPAGPAPKLIEENSDPLGPYRFPVSTEHHTNETRRWLAIILMAMLAIVVLAGAIGWILWGDDPDRMQNFSVVFSPLFTLAAGALGFYFSRSPT